MNNPPKSPWSLILILAVSLPLLPACGGGGGESEAKAFPAKYLSAICSSIVRCTGAIAQSECETRFKSLYDGVFKDVLDAEAKGTVRYDPASADRCLAGARALTCDSIDMAEMQNLGAETMMLKTAGCSEVFQPN
jgi:hypothetical protein